MYTLYIYICIKIKEAPNTEGAEGRRRGHVTPTLHSIINSLFWFITSTTFVLPYLSWLLILWNDHTAWLRQQ